MSKVVLAIILIMAGCRTNAQGSLTDTSIIVYSLKNISIILVGESITDSLLNQPGIHKQAASKQRVIFVHGEAFKIIVATNKEPFLHPVNKVEFDADTNDPERIAIKDVEMTSSLDGRFTAWRDEQNFLLDRDSISLHPIATGKIPVAKGDYYTIFAWGINPFSNDAVIIRNKNTKEELLHFRVKGIGYPISPFLTHVAQDAVDKRVTDSFLQINSGITTEPRITRHKEGVIFSYQFPETIADTSTILKNQNLYDASGLILYFKKRHYYRDSTIEYRLFSESDNDTNWIKGSHRLVTPPLVPGNHYKLQVRYNLHPQLIREHTFYVVPKWYQTTQTKVIIAGLLLLIALLTWLFIYKRRLDKSRTRRDQLSLEIKAIRSQLNPHFIFNALSSIQGLVNKNDIPAANLYLTEFSTLLRESLHNNDKEMVPLVTEINLLETYLKLEQLRFDFKYEINIDEAIDKNGTEIPNLILQPLVENAVKHGVSTLAGEGFIKISFIKREHDLLVLIADNGNKFDETQSTDGFGLKLTNNRIALLSQTIKEQPIQLTIERRQDMETIVNLVFKNWI
jgi:hypothetical protein